jgi:hypothetical protein
MTIRTTHERTSVSSLQQKVSHISCKQERTSSLVIACWGLWMTRHRLTTYVFKDRILLGFREDELNYRQLSIAWHKPRTYSHVPWFFKHSFDETLTDYIQDGVWALSQSFTCCSISSHRICGRILERLSWDMSYVDGLESFYKTICLASVFDFAWHWMFLIISL